MSTRIEFRCSLEERRKIEAGARKKGQTVGKYLLDQSIYRRGRSSLKTEEKICLCRMRTYLNGIEDGINEEENIQKILEECRGLCQSLK